MKREKRMCRDTWEFRQNIESLDRNKQEGI